MELSDLKRNRIGLFGLFRPSFTVYRKSLLFLAAICVFVYAPIYIIFELFPAQLTLTQADVLNHDIDKIMAYMYSSLAVITIFAPLSTAAVTCVCRACVEGRRVSFASILDGSLLKWPRLVISALIFTVIFTLSAPLIILPVYFAVSFAFYVNIIAITGSWGFGALLESRRVVKGRWWATAGALLVINILEILISIVLASLLPMNIESANAALIIAIKVIIEVFCCYFEVLLSLYFLNNYYLYLGGRAYEAGEV